MTELTQPDKDRDAIDGYALALSELRKRGIRNGSIQPLNERERREADEKG